MRAGEGLSEQARAVNVRSCREKCYPRSPTNFHKRDPMKLAVCLLDVLWHTDTPRGLQW
jgi:hypothetical protein